MDKDKIKLEKIWNLEWVNLSLTTKNHSNHSKKFTIIQFIENDEKINSNCLAKPLEK